MSTMNRRAVLVRPRDPLLLEEKPIHATPPTGVVVKTHYAGICHTDVHLWENELSLGEGVVVPILKDEILPIVMGQEVSGEIYSIGSAVTCDLKLGDKVVIYSWGACKECSRCKAGRENFCLTNMDYAVGCSSVEGGYQQYVAVSHAEDVVKVPDNVPMDVAALLPCSGLAAYNAIQAARPVLEEFIKMNGKASLLVVGVGGLGQWAIPIAKALIPEGLSVVAVDISEEKVALAKDAGADETLIWPILAKTSDIVEASKQVAPTGFEASVDFVNNSLTIGRIVETLTKGGIAVQVGLFGGSAHTVPLGILAIKCLSIVCSFVRDTKVQSDLLNLVSTHNIKSPPIIKVKLDEAGDYLQRLKEGRVNGRAVIDHVDNCTRRRTSSSALLTEIL